VLRRRALYQAGLFGSFSLFWTVVPLELTGPDFGLSQTGIAIFALVGMAGAIASPVAGRLADSGHTLAATAGALLLGVIGYALPLISTQSHMVSLAILVAASIILDMAVAANLVLGQRAIFALAADIRSRLNGLYFALTFAGGAAGSALGGWMYATHGWHAALLTGMAFPAIAFLGWLVEYASHAATRRTAGQR
jgi:predicted MFS family arabinose efflux permease